MASDAVTAAKAGVTSTTGAAGGVGVAPVNAAGLPALGMSAGHPTAIQHTPFAVPAMGPGQQGQMASGSYDQSIAPKYFDGDEYLIASMDPVELSQLQVSLRNAGVLQAGYVSGLNSDPGTIAAMKELMSEGNQSGYTWGQVLTQRLNAPQVPKTPTKPYTAPAYLKPDPATLKESVRQLMQQVIGPDRQPTDAELADLTSRLGALDRGRYDATTAQGKANYDAAAAGTQEGAVASSLGGDATVAGGSTVQAVDPSSQLADYLRTTYKPEIDMAKGTADLSKNQAALQGSFLSIANAIRTPAF